LALILFLSTGWSWLTHLGARRRALQNETVMPAPPILPVIFSVLLVGGFFLWAAKTWDMSETRATIVVEKVSVLTAPTDQSASLFDLFEGLEVVVRQTHDNWMQVTYPGGMTGWIPKTSLFITQYGDLR
jgi:hypothetical protein